MAEKTVDARGLSCPEPVLLAKRAIKDLECGVIDVLVDTATSCENVTRMAHSLSCSVEVTEQENDNFVLHVKKDSHE
jgi:TusA-related sulfurtransferase